MTESWGSAAEREQIRINEWFNSDWGPLIEEQEAQAEAERDAVERARCGGFGVRSFL